MALNLTLPPKSASERDPAANSEGFQAGVNAERAKWVEAGALKGQIPAAGAVSWDEITAEINAKCNLG
ncbi:hypothetical protein [Methylobacterium sp. J-068]|uniref:hypothetical protein n=1 Tax=Methylobacterium sp. J-068 TaxID=2836649 RepID=UPI001FBA70C5|nr:hypothetical protein [Methylobacterium sp. J-068]MCJ2032621.1 hypothetical protein [Methylobacterium sp. J-068]